MNAIIQEQYGSPDMLRLADIDMPVVADDQVLVRVRAASLNSGDWRRVRGAPFLVRTDSGLLKPQAQGVATDAAGEVESVGKDVTDMKPGDRVYGVRLGACGEYVAGTKFVPMPANLTFEQAAAIPVAGCTALQAVRDHGGVKPGQRVLINGAGGGVGTYLVQIAKAHGAEVTAVSSTDKVDMLRSIGADHVVDYTREDFAKTTERYDVVFDIGGNRSIGASRKILAPGGKIVQIGVGKGHVGPLLRLLNGVIRMRLFKQPIVVFIANVNKDDLGVLREMAESGKLVPVIDRTYPLAETPAAFHRLETTHATGKIVITI
jgi:NADPH:quinone reductase-like Zn-dependent oxidoreductase